MVQIAKTKDIEKFDTSIESSMGRYETHTGAARFVLRGVNNTNFVEYIEHKFKNCSEGVFQTAEIKDIEK